ncbi:MAG: branched-chain amino acid transaminase [Sphingobacteriales bacterium]|nr:branched-chain amino acid transaminase [Sphingobacteriales bacterium]
MYYHANTLLFLDGQYIKASEAHTDLYSQTLHYGNGVFEGIRAYNTGGGTRIFKAKEHFERLLYSARMMHITLPYTAADLESIAYEVLAKNNLSDAYLRPLAYLGANMSLTPTTEVHFTMMAWEWGKYLGDQLTRVYLSSYCRPHPKSCHVEAKTVGHYTNSILATTEAKSKGYDEALLCDMNGFVAEGSGANFFFEKNKTLYTAPLGNILAGITRATVLELAAAEGIQIVEKHFTPEEVLQADSAFFCGTAAEIAGIASLNDYVFPLAWQNSLGTVLQKKYKARVVEY